MSVETITWLAAAVTVVAVIVGGVWKLVLLGNAVQDGLKELNTRLDTMSRDFDARLQGFDGRLEDLKAGSYTVAAAAEHALRTAMLNPGMRLPDPRDPRAVLCVDHGS